jgi:hypothetical protein
MALKVHSNIILRRIRLRRIVTFRERDVEQQDRGDTLCCQSGILDALHNDSPHFVICSSTIICLLQYICAAN